MTYGGIIRRRGVKAITTFKKLIKTQTTDILYLPYDAVTQLH